MLANQVSDNCRLPRLALTKTRGQPHKSMTRDATMSCANAPASATLQVRLEATTEQPRTYSASIVACNVQ
eukprot:scaffold136053_cov33-Tisochrysis_lutea.AAC.3